MEQKMKWPDDFVNKIVNMDCLVAMKQLPDKCVDLVLTDPPYGTTNLEWDIVPNFENMWSEVNRIGKDSCAVVFTASQPFTTDLINSNRNNFRYELIWDKDRPTGFALANVMPMKVHENLLIFYKKSPTYNPIMEKGKPSANGWNQTKKNQSQPQMKAIKKIYTEDKYPKSIIRIKKNGASTYLHPTQKPLDLFAYLIRTYSNENDLILDPFLGSGTTAVAAKQLGRKFIGIEISEKYCKIARDRLRQEVLF